MYKTIANYDGDGFYANPYIINDRKDLHMLSLIVNSGETYSGKYFLQTDNIDLEKMEWKPIGIYGSGHYFDGTYNGNNKYISNLCTTDSSSSNKDNNGLFGTLNGTVINLGIESGTVMGDCVGAITSHGGNHSAIINCYNKANVFGNNRAGGIADNMNGGKIICCINEGQVSANNSSAQILSYNASEVSFVTPTDNYVNTNYNGYTINVECSGDTIQEQLNCFLLYFSQNEMFSNYELSLWN